MTLLEISNRSDHETVLFFQDKKVGLKGFISIHNTKLGPAIGGTRYMNYASEKEALEEALRLSKAMTYKCALAGVPYGGGKAVIMADPQNPKTKEYLQAYAKKVNFLSGNFFTGEDVGMNQNDIEILAEASPFIKGRVSVGGSPSEFAAFGVFCAIEAGLEDLFGNSSVKGKRIAIKGLGQLGMELCRLLYLDGAIITATDKNSERIAMVKEKFPNITIVSPDSIHKIPVDVYAPCALGGEFTEKNVTELQCRLVCGGANNQLSNEAIGLELYRRNIIYIPDYLANSGGLINVVAECDKEGYSREHVQLKVKNIKKMAATIISLSRLQKKPTNFIADEMAQSVFNSHTSLTYV